MIGKSNRPHIIIYIAFVYAIAISCSTEKNAWPNRTFHNMTAHYNGYFNAGEIIKQTMFDFRNGRKDDFTKMLPVYEYPNDEESKALYSPMDTAAKKCETVISRNSMPNEKAGQYRNQEWCKWIDDNWLVVGQSRFYKRDFDEAEKVFKYIQKNYKTEQIIYEASIWLVKTYIEQERYIEAEELLKDLEKQQEDRVELIEEAEEAEQKAKEKAKKRGKKYKKKKSDELKLPPEFPKHFDRKLAPIYADLYLRQKDYKKAEEWLIKAIDLTKKKPFKARLTFILAQIKQKQGSPEASELYAKVIRLNPEYDMAFQAQIQRALAYSGGDSRSVKSQLLKMLKDDKNVEYLDQIYYALADIELRGGDRKKGIEYLELSVANSVANNEQKSKSFLRLGKLFYQEKNYIKAQQYYDSTMAVLPEDHDEYSTIESQNKSLTELVDNLNTVNEADSLLSLCSKSEKEIIAEIEDLIQQKRIAKQKEEEERNNSTNFLVNTGGGNTASTGGKFWVWDNNLRGVGFTDFKKVWGNRKLEDNWRRSDKSSVDFEENELEGDSAEADEFSVEYYLSNLPCGDDQKTNQLKEDLIVSLYNSGMIYKVKFEDLPAAKSAFEKLSNNYLPHSKAIAGMYQMYLMTSGDEQQKWKNKILSDFPDTEYAKLILDPSYKEKENELKNNAEKEYAITYQKYTLRQYDEVIKECNMALKDSANLLTCKYKFLKVNALGMLYSGVEDSLVVIEKGLESIVKTCEGSPYYDLAKSNLDKLRNINSINNARNGKSTYIYAPDIQHYFVLIIPNGEGNSNEIKVSISNFNKNSFSGSNIKTTSSFLDLDNQLVLVKSFLNKKAAMDYYTAFRVNKNELKDFNTDHIYFVITAKNYASFFIEKNVDDYMEFFNINYQEQ